MSLAIFYRSPTDEQYRLRGVSLIKFIYFDSCLVFVDFDTFSLIKEKYIFGFKCFILIFQLIFDFHNLTRLICQLHFWFPKFPRLNPFDSFSRCLIFKLSFDFENAFDFQKFVAFDFSNDTFDFQNLLSLFSQMAFLISKMRLIWILSERQFLRVVSPTQGRGDTQSMVTTRPNKAARVF